MPPKEPKKPLPKDEVPQDWSSRLLNRKLDWLHTQGCPEEYLVSLGATYLRGCQVTHWIKILYKALKMIEGKLKQGGPSKDTKSLWKELATNFNKGLKSLNEAIYAECVYLIANGKYANKIPSLDPVPIKDELDPELDDLISKKPALPPANDDDDEWWSMYQDVLLLLCKQFPRLTLVRPELGGSYAELITAFAKATSGFLKAWKKDKGDKNHGDLDDGWVPLALDEPPSLPVPVDDGDEGQEEEQVLG